MSEIYEITNTSNEDVNKLTVDFTFSPEVSKEDAVALIEELISLADNNMIKLKAKVQLMDHEPRFWEISQFNRG